MNVERGGEVGELVARGVEMEVRSVKTPAADESKPEALNKRTPELVGKLLPILEKYLINFISL